MGFYKTIGVVLIWKVANSIAGLFINLLFLAKNSCSSVKEIK